MDTHYADTTVVYYKLHSHSRLKEAVNQAVGKGTLTVSNFVRGEYIRGYVIGLIELFYAIKAEASVQDGIYHFIGLMGTRHPRKVGNALQSAANWFGGLEEATDVDKTLRRLGEHIRATLIQFDATFVRRARDPLECEIGVMSFPSETYQEKHIVDFYAEHARIRAKPTCEQCDFRRDQAAMLAEAKIDLESAKVQNAYAEHQGFVKQSKAIVRARGSRKKEPSCWHCDRLGDTIIVLSAPSGLTIVSGDKQSFPPLAKILDKPLTLIPSIQQLRSAQAEEENESSSR